MSERVGSEERPSVEGSVNRFGAVLFTDIDDSTGLWERHADLMPEVLARHNELVTSAVTRAGGTIVKNRGDGFLAVFDDPEAALSAAAQVEMRLSEDGWLVGQDEFTVRVAIDLGEIERRDGDIAGSAVNRCSRILDVARRGQILVSDDVAERSHVEGLAFVDLGEFPLRGIGAPVGLHRVEPIELPSRSPPEVPGAVSPTGARSSMRGFELRERIGAGVAGVVYRAYQRSVGREVAIKLIRPEFANDRRFVHRFETEAQFIARLEHPHVVSLYDYWRDPDGAYLVMRWLRGGSLRQALDRGPWHEDRAVRLLQQVGSALAYAHRHGVIHRDIRPSNVLLDDEDNGYLSDFGIASRPITVGGGSVSTSPEYRSPEEASGQPLTEATDQYCLGLLAHELLTGTRPSTPFVIDLGDDVAAKVIAAVARATAVNPAERFSSVEAFIAALAPSGTAAALPTEVSRDPFKGLRPFFESDAADFAGRDELIERLVTAVRERRLVAAVGASGSGKSSAVRAGLIPALRAGAILGSDQWLVTDLYPGAHPFDELAVALLGVATEPLPDLPDELSADATALLRAVKTITPQGSELVLVVDQFEELFTLSDEATQRAFVNSLVELVSDPHARARVVVTLRADFYDRPLAFSLLAPLLDLGLVTVGAPAADELAQAITAPSENVGLVVEPALVELIVDQVVDQPGGLPLLQYTLSELFQRRDHNRLTIDAFQDIGGVTGALASRADALFSGLDADGRSAAEQVFLRLVSLDETGDPTRRRVLTSELGESPSVQVVLETYGASRLLTFDRDPVTRDPTVEVAHEALLQGWPRLADWIDHRRDDLVTHRRFSLARSEWDNRDRDPAYLLSGPRLAHFETWAGDTHLALTDSERAFLTLSRSEENRLQARRQRIRRLVTAGFAIIALVASLFAVVALVQRNRAEENELAAEKARIEAEAHAREAERQQRIAEDQTDIAEANADEARRASALARSRELAAAAIATVDEDPQLSILLALEAADMADPPPASIEALHRAVQSQELIYEIQLERPAWLEWYGPTAEWSLSPDGTKIAITSDGVAVEVMDVPSGTPVSRFAIPEDSLFELEGRTTASDLALRSEGLEPADAYCRNMFASLPMQAVAFSPDGSLIASILADGYLHVFDAATGTPLGLRVPRLIEAITDPCYPYAVVDFTPDGEGVVTAVRTYLGNSDFEQDVSNWSVDDGDLLATVPTAMAGISVDVSQDRTWAATGNLWWGTLIVDDLTGGSDRVEFEVSNTVVFDAAISHDDQHVITVARDGIARVWDVAAQSEVGRFVGPETSIDVSSSGTLVGTGLDGTVYAWDLNTGRPIAVLHGHDGVVWDVEVSADGATVASGPDTEGRIKVWDIGGVSRAEVSGVRVPAYRTARVDVTEDHVAVLTRNDEREPGSLYVYDPATWQAVAQIPDQFGWVTRFTPSGDGLISQDWLGAAGWSEPSETDVRVRSVTDSTDQTPPFHVSSICDPFFDRGEFSPWCPEDPGFAQSEVWVFVRDADMTPAGDLIAVAYWGPPFGATVWDTSTGEVVAGWSEDAYFSGIRFSPDGELLVVVHGPQPDVYRVGEWEEPIVELEPLDYSAQYIEFSPDGSMLAIQASESTHVAVWDVVTWTKKYDLREHEGNVTDLDFSPDGELLVTSGEDGTARIWDTDSGRSIGVLPVPGEGEVYIRFAPWEPNHLIAVAESGIVSELTLDRDELMEIARNKLFRGFTDSECERFALDSCAIEP